MKKTARVHGVIPSDTSSLNTPACSRNVLQNPTCVPLAPTRVTFSAHTSCQIDTPVWTAISTVSSYMYSNNRINHELTNFDVVHLVHSKVYSVRDVSYITRFMEMLPLMNLLGLYIPRFEEMLPLMNLLGLLIPHFADMLPLLTRKLTRL